jgi:hypothetical protein
MSAVKDLFVKVHLDMKEVVSGVKEMTSSLQSLEPIADRVFKNIGKVAAEAGRDQMRPLQDGLDVVVEKSKRAASGLRGVKRAAEEAGAAGSRASFRDVSSAITAQRDAAIKAAEAEMRGGRRTMPPGMEGARAAMKQQLFEEAEAKRRVARELFAGGKGLGTTGEAMAAVEARYKVVGKIDPGELSAFNLQRQKKDALVAEAAREAAQTARALSYLRTIPNSNGPLNPAGDSGLPSFGDVAARQAQADIARRAKLDQQAKDLAAKRREGERAEADKFAADEVARERARGMLPPRPPPPGEPPAGEPFRDFFGDARRYNAVQDARAAAAARSSAAVRAALSSAGSAAASFGGQALATASATGALFSSTFRMAGLIGSGLVGAFRSAASAAAGFAGSVLDAANAAGSSAFARVAAGGLLLFAREMVSANSTFEKAGISLEALTGSAAAGARMLRELQDFSAAKPFALSGLEANAQFLLTQGFAAEKVIPILHRLADAVALRGVGDPTRAMESATLAMVRIQNQGKLTYRDIRALASTMDIIGALARKTNETRDAVTARIRAGGVGAGEALNAIMGIADDPRYRGSAEKIGGTFSGMLTRLRSTFQQFSAVAGKPLFDAARDSLRSLLDYLQSAAGRGAAERIAAGLSAVIAAARPLASAVAGWVPYILGAGAALGGLALAMPLVNAGLRVASALVGVLASGLRPMNLLLAGSAVLFASGVFGSLDDLKGRVLGVWAAISAFVSRNRELAQTVAGVTLTVAAIVGAFKLAAGVLSALGVSQAVSAGLWLAWTGAVLVAKGAVLAFAVTTAALTAAVHGVSFAVGLFAGAVTTMAGITGLASFAAFLAVWGGIKVAVELAGVAAQRAGAAFASVGKTVSEAFGAVSGGRDKLSGVGDAFREWWDILRRIAGVAAYDMPGSLEILKLSAQGVADDIRRIFPPIFDLILKGFAAVWREVAENFGNQFKAILAQWDAQTSVKLRNGAFSFLFSDAERKEADDRLKKLKDGSYFLREEYEERRKENQRRVEEQAKIRDDENSTFFQRVEARGEVERLKAEWEVERSRMGKMVTALNAIDRKAESGDYSPREADDARKAVAREYTGGESAAAAISKLIADFKLAEQDATSLQRKAEIRRKIEELEARKAAGLPPETRSGAGSIPRPYFDETTKDKFEFMGFADLWKKTQASISGDDMFEFTRRAAMAAEGTESHSKRAADGIERLLERPDAGGLR